MNAQEFYDYVNSKYNLDSIASRLVQNAIAYIEAQDFVYADDGQRHLSYLLNGAFGLKRRDLLYYRSPECIHCGRSIAISPYSNSFNKNREMCEDCLAEHCGQTNCLNCAYGKYPECPFLAIKRKEREK